jgi:hypothetical protein
MYGAVAIGTEAVMVMVSKGVEAIILMGDAPLLGVLVKYPISWREGFGAVVMHISAKSCRFASAFLQLCA